MDSTLTELTAASAAKIRDPARGKKSLQELRKYVDEQVIAYSKIGVGRFDLLHTQVYKDGAYEELIEAL